MKFSYSAMRTFPILGGSAIGYSARVSQTQEDRTVVHRVERKIAERMRRAELSKMTINVHDEHELCRWAAELQVAPARLKALVRQFGVQASEVRKGLAAGYTSD